MTDRFSLRLRGWRGVTVRVGRPPCKTYWIDLRPPWRSGSYWFVGDAVNQQPSGTVTPQE